MIVCDVCAPEHAHIATKWCPAMNLATECVEKVQQEHLMLRQNDGAPQTWAYGVDLYLK